MSEVVFEYAFFDGTLEELKKKFFTNGFRDYQEGSMQKKVENERYIIIRNDKSICLELNHTYFFDARCFKKYLDKMELTYHIVQDFDDSPSIPKEVKEHWGS